MNIAADFILSALGTKNFEDEDEYFKALTGAMILADGLFELTKIRKMIHGALKK